MGSRAAAAVAACLICVSGLSACGPGSVEVDATAPGATADEPSPSTQPSGPRPLRLDFSEITAATVIDDVLPGPWPPGVEVAVISRGGGRVVGGPGPQDVDGAVRLPAYDPRARRFAVLRVSTTRGLPSPGERDFTFGVEAVIDATSAGTSVDDGDNLVQRGLFGPGSQFKLQVDRGIASCRVAGDEGGVIAELGRRLESEVWHRIRCTRIGDTVTIDVTALLEDGERPVGSSSARGSIGAVDLGVSTPLSVGGKLGITGQLAASSTDQLNGAVGRVFYEPLG